LYIDIKNKLEGNETYEQFFADSGLVRRTSGGASVVKSQIS